MEKVQLQSSGLSLFFFFSLMSPITVLPSTNLIMLPFLCLAMQLGQKAVDFIALQFTRV